MKKLIKRVGCFHHSNRKNYITSSEGAKLFMTLYGVQGKKINIISRPERAKLLSVTPSGLIDQVFSLPPAMPRVMNSLNPSDFSRHGIVDYWQHGL